MNYVDTPNGGDTICPKCGQCYCKICSAHVLGYKVPDNASKDACLQITYVDFKNYEMCYCKVCGFYFDLSHSYEVNGCSDDLVYYTSIVEYSIDGAVKTGQPDVKGKEGTVKIHKLKCSCDGEKPCNGGRYPASKYPQYYKFDCPVYISVSDTVTE